MANARRVGFRTPLGGVVELQDPPTHLTNKYGERSAMLTLKLADSRDVRRAEVLLTETNLIDLIECARRFLQPNEGEENV